MASLVSLAGDEIELGPHDGLAILAARGVLGLRTGVEGRFVVVLKLGASSPARRSLRTVLVLPTARI
jgi:hypothetical protein